MKDTVNFIEKNGFEKVGNFERCYNLENKYFYNIVFSYDEDYFCLTKYTKKFGTFLYQKKFKKLNELKKFLEENNI